MFATTSGPALLLLLLLLSCRSGQAAYDMPEDCSWSTAGVLSAPSSGGETSASGGSSTGSPGDAGVFLTCRLSSINSRLERTNFTVIPAEGTRGLRVLCTSSEPAATTSTSHLEPKGFAHLHELNELAIEGCALARLPREAFAGLGRLQRLSVHGAAAVGGVELAVEPGALPLPSLHYLDLSHNGLVGLPAGELCQLGSQLRQLNLSSNAIASLASLTGGDQTQNASCLASLESLDLSGNELTEVDSGGLVVLAPRLQELRLSSNYIRSLSPGAAGLPGSNSSRSTLRLLDLSGNQISLLPPTLLEAHPQLESLLLARNLLSKLPASLLAGQKLLQRLDLSGNLLQQLPANLIGDLVSLTHLNLAANQMEALDFLSSSSGQPHSLQVLQLSANRLRALSWPSAAFPYLQELDLSDNQLDTIRAEDLSGMSGLSHLSLARNHIVAIHPAAFRPLAGLLVLDLSQNRLTDVPEGLKHLASLQTLDLGGNLIEAIGSGGGDVNAGSTNSPLTVMTSLWRLQLHNNRIRSVSHTAFTHLTSLQVLDLSANQIVALDRGTFDQNRLLRAVRLDANQLTEMDGVFTHLPELTWLNISANQIQQFDYALVPRTLNWLDISHNRITMLGNYFDIGEDMALSYLNAGFNSLKTVGPSDLPERLETVLLNDNKISEVMPYTLFNKAALTRVDLSVNSISSLSQTALRLAPSLMTDVPSLSLGGNPIVCDCDLQWLKSVNEDNNSVQRYPVVSDLESIYCRLVYTQEQAFVPLVEARSDQFLCSYQTHCFSLCQCCQFDSCDCEMTCPVGCICYHDNSWTKNIIQCSSAQLLVIPDSIPMDATEVFLDGNRFEVLKSHTFIGRKNLHSIHLNSSNIEKIENQTFNGLKTLSALHLENNSLQALNGFEFSGLSHLKELYLQGNKITSIHNTTFRGLKSLEVLFLQGNLIISFPVWQLTANPYLVSIRLAENLWSCDCDFLQQLYDWLQMASSKVFDAEHIQCVSNEAISGHSRKISAFELSTCSGHGAVAKSQIKRPDNDEEHLKGNYLPLMIAMLASFAAICLLGLVTFLFRNSIRVWIHARTGVRVFESLETTSRRQHGGPEAGRLFDAYLSYSLADEAFVRQVLAHEMEAVSQYRVCLHHRDFPQASTSSSEAGSSSTAETVMRAAEVSHRTVIVLSANFIKTEWSRYDYKSGLLQAVNNGGHGRKIVFILLGSVEGGQLEPSLRLLLKNNILLHWGEPLFWEKLRYSLPDPEQKAQPQQAAYDRVSGLQHQHRRQQSSPSPPQFFTPPTPVPAAAYRNAALHI